MTKREVHFTLNGRSVTYEVEPRTTLLRALRHHGVTSVKRGCEEGECGTCTVLLDGVPVKSCTVLALEVEGRSVLTAEGLVGKDGKLHPVQQAFRGRRHPMRFLYPRHGAYDLRAAQKKP